MNVIILAELVCCYESSLLISLLQLMYFGEVKENSTSGLKALRMTARDKDDPNESSNAKLTYEIQRNVIDEKTGTPIFAIEPETGIIKTAKCCLDREKTPDYFIIITATDGGGLKGKVLISIIYSFFQDYLIHVRRIL